MNVTVCGEPRTLEPGATLREAVARFTPYSDEATICKLNGAAVKSIDMDAPQPLREGDVIEIYPLIIGG